MINLKDIIGINQEIGETGDLQNKSSLEFSIQLISRQRKSWLYELSYLIRSLLVDHSFVDGNKRTSFALILFYLDEKGIDYDKKRIIDVVYTIARKNVKDINAIARLIKNGYGKVKADN
jgi:prophage maintenance system killer protein